MENNNANIVGSEAIKPYDTERSKGEQVEQMFDSIAPAYDFMNTAMTFGLHRLWRNKALSLLPSRLPAQCRILDLACGTGDVTIHLAALMPKSRITGADLSTGMLDVAQRKLTKLPPDRSCRITFEQADALHLPYPDNSFDAITIAYGVRNFENLRAGYTEMLRVLKPGGTLLVIELCEPSNPVMRLGYNFYSRYLIPFVGRLVSKDSEAYSYLPQSIHACPQRAGMVSLIQEAGYSSALCKTLFPGVCAIYIGQK